jgi:hypothetical protein
MTLAALRAYAELLGATFTLRTFDGGQQLQMTYGKITYIGSFEWDQRVRFIKRATKWLHELPWPTDDDPRVQGEY